MGCYETLCANTTGFCECMDSAPIDAINAMIPLLDNILIAAFLIGLATILMVDLWEKLWPTKKPRRAKSKRRKTAKK